MSRFNSMPVENAFPRPSQINKFSNLRDGDQKPAFNTKPLKPVDVHKGAEPRPFPKPLMVNPNFTVNSIENRFNPPVFNNTASSDSRGDAVGVKPSSISQQENFYTKAQNAGVKPSIMQKPVAHKNIFAVAETAPEDPSLPKEKPLPNVFALGKCPAKPKRPPHVDLQKFRDNVSNSSIPEQALSLPPPPPPERPSITSMAPPPPADFTLPPPPPMDPTLQEDYYDDTDILNRTDASLGQFSNDAEEEEEMYEDLEQNWEENCKELKEEKTTKESKELKKKIEKEEKKRLEQEKKDKKEREKRLQEARKKFKIKDPIVVVETVKTKVDHKGGKNKLPLKQGETIDILRKTENPKDYWLARNSEGQYGFVKPNTLDISCDGVRHTEDGQDVYDDVGTDDVDNNLPDAEGDSDIYDCPDEQQGDFSFPPPPPLVQTDMGVFDDTYDDVVPTEFPPPPASPNSFPKLSSSSKMDEMDPKKKKKFEKEEKEFRKKFKYNSEIKVLYEATVLQTLSVKKFGNKDLQLKPGETIDVIVHPADGKLIARNSEGRFGYVSTANLEQDGSIYDDVGDECIYDND